MAAASAPPYSSANPPQLQPRSSASPGIGSAGSNTLDEAAIDTATLHVHEAIRNLLADEIPDLAEDKGLLVFNDPYLNITFSSFKSYLHFEFLTWLAVANSFGHLLTGHVSLIDWFTLFLFSSLISGVLTMGVIMCLICKFPLVESMFGIYSAIHGGFSFTNSLNTHMFNSLTGKELRQAKAALASTDARTSKDFNIDIAKICLILASVVYERTSEGTRAALKHTHAVPKSRHRKGSISPGKASPRGVGGSYPMTPVSPLTPPTSGSGSTYGRLGRPKHQHHRSLSHLSSRIASQMHDISEKAQTHPRHLLKVFGKSAQEVQALLHGEIGDNVIQDLVGRLDLEYEPISELNSSSSSYAAIFWDRRMNWVIVAFKGTSPAEFDEWLTDFDITRVPAGHHLPGYQNIHRGFKSRLFPEKDAMHRSPYETIMASLKLVTNDLLSRTNKDVNVYFTGHSLGCAIGSLTYTKALLGLDGLDPRVQICDAYLFGAPVVCDMASAKNFNDYLTHRKSQAGRIHTIWRVTNRADAVTTLLPMLGDDPLYPHKDSLFAYAHLGSEVKMRPGSGKSIIVDNYCSPNDTKARVVSGTTEEDFYSDDETVDGYVGYGTTRTQRDIDSRKGKKKSVGVPALISAMEYMPFFGRVVSHFPGLYFRSLQQMEPGEFVWRRS